MLKLIVSQLQEYNYSNVAEVVATAVGMEEYSLDPSSRLSELVGLGQQAEDIDCDNQLEGGDCIDEEEEEKTHSVLDAPKFNETKPMARMPMMSTTYAGYHKSFISQAVYSPDGQFVATGSHDNDLKVIKVETLQKDEEVFVKTMHENSGIIHDVAFHPMNLVLASCSEDHMVRFYDITRSSSKRSFRYLADTYPVYSISFHPGGLFLAAGTAHPNIRLYDVHQFKCYTTTEPAHQGGVTVVRMSPDGKTLASTGFDGAVRVWDAQNGTPISTWKKAHQGEHVSSLCWSKNSKYLLSSGRDSTIRLHEVTSGRTVKSYVGATHDRTKLNACFSHLEDMVVSTDEKTGQVIFWDIMTSEIVGRLDSMHSAVTSVNYSPNQHSLITYSMDGIYKIWNSIN